MSKKLWDCTHERLTLNYSYNRGSVKGAPAGQVLFNLILDVVCPDCGSKMAFDVVDRQTVFSQDMCSIQLPLIPQRFLGNNNDRKSPTTTTPDPNIKLL